MINILEYLEKTASLYPNATAFKDPEKSVTFKDLTETAKRVGIRMILGKGLPKVNTSDGVAFYMEKSTDTLSVMFGAVYANAFYSFIDVRQPAERACKVISLLDPVMIITDDEDSNSLKEILSMSDTPPFVVNINNILDDEWLEPIDQDILDNRRALFYDTLPLYVNFTSGSTGTPKGVVVGHRSVIDFINVFTKTFGITKDDVFANQAPFDFDVSVKDIYSGIFTGATVCLIPRPYFTNPTVLMDYLCDNKTTVIVWAVSAMCFVSIMNGLDYKTPDTLKKIMFSGEIMPVKQLNKWKDHLPFATYVNLYGPTEITCNCTYYILDRDFEKNEILPIGIPFVNEKVFLLDENDCLVTENNTEGEICVSGSCLALGYFRDEDKTRSAFTENPANPRYYERIYRTGDLGMYLPDGNMVYTSRKDFQVKHMGQRVELGEIEVTAMSVDNVSRACCLYDEKHQKIILFYTGDSDRDTISNALHAKLPPYMIPGKTIKLEAFPMNKNGKIDRNALKEQI